jgi:hypothetical protein
VILSTAGFLGLLGRASQKPFWFDELLTVYLGQLPSLRDVWAALMIPVDLNPPLNVAATRVSTHVFGDGLIATRAPAAIGFVLAGICVFGIVRERYGALSGAAAAALLYLSGAYAYGYEARPYGLLLGFSAAVIWSWMSATLPHRRRPALAGVTVSLAAVVSTHYYGVLLLAPLIAGEVVRAYSRRKPDWTLWLSILLGLAPLVAWAPLIGRAHTYSAGYFGKASVRGISDFYRELLEPLWLGGLAALMIIALTQLLDRGTRGDEGAERQVQPESHVLIVMLVLALLPCVLFAVSLVSGGFLSRYALPAALGICILAGFTTGRRPGITTPAQVAIIVAAMIKQASGGAMLARSAPPLDFKAGILAQADSAAATPIVVSHPRVFLPLWHYGDARLKSRLVYVTQPANLVREGNVDTGDRNLTDLEQIVPITVQPFESFIQAHSRFFVYGPSNWIVDELNGRGARLIVKGHDSEGSAFFPEDSLLFDVSQH